MHPRRPLALIVAVAVATSILAARPLAAEAQSWPGDGHSYYVQTTDTQAHYDKGCAIANNHDANEPPQDYLAIMIWGQALRNSSGGYGASEYGGDNGFAGVTEIKNAMYEFARGWAVCISPDPDAHLQLAVATTNNGSYPAMTSAQITAHGQAWANMVDGINSKIVTAGFNSRVQAVGGNDIEPGWGTYGDSKTWVDGYDSANSWPYYFVGSADGCPPYGSCNNGWSQARMHYVAFGNSAAWPVPQIYTGSGSQATQWQAISEWGVNNGKPKIVFYGALTQHNICGSGCSGTDNTPNEGWTQLYTKINADSKTTGSIRWSTDMFAYLQG